MGKYKQKNVLKTENAVTWQIPFFFLEFLDIIQIYIYIKFIVYDITFELGTKKKRKKNSL